MPQVAKKEDIQPASALTFAETLLLCPTEDAVRSHMQRDPAGAMSFRTASVIVAREIETGNVSIEGYETGPNTPFYLLALLVHQWLVGWQAE